MSTPEELAELVEKTEGVQYGRRIFHAAWGCVLAGLIVWWPWPKGALVGLLGLAFVVLLLADVLRLRNPGLNAAFFRAFRWFASPREERQVASSTWYILGAILVVWPFEPAIAAAAILVLAFADPAASVVGRLWGGRALGKGTRLGFAVFATVAAAVLAFFQPWPVALGAGLIVALVECQPIGLDDNLTVPITTALAVSLLGSFV